ncbi:unnamed protein product [Symbiodinium sp. CCMP2592]|nr:unnamed protein product [Symbiodinium sp. CCMP2592]
MAPNAHWASACWLLCHFLVLLVYLLPVLTAGLVVLSFFMKRTDPAVEGMIDEILDFVASYWLWMLLVLVLCAAGTGFIGFRKAKICASLGLLAFDMLSDLLVLYKLAVTMQQPVWSIVCLALLLLNPIQAYLKTQKAVDFFYSFVHVLEVGVKALCCEEHADFEAEFVRLKFNEALFESLPQLGFQTYFVFWLTIMRSKCAGLASSDTSSSFGFNVSSYDYWHCDQLQNPAWQVQWFQYLSLAVGAASMVFGVADWGKMQFDRQGLKCSLFTWICISFALTSRSLHLLVKMLHFFVLELDTKKELKRAAVQQLLFGFVSRMSIICLNDAIWLSVHAAANERERLSCRDSWLLAISSGLLSPLIPVPSFGTLQPEALKAAICPWLIIGDVEARRRYKQPEAFEVEAAFCFGRFLEDAEARRLVTLLFRILFACACFLVVLEPISFLLGAIRYCYTGSFLMAAIGMAEVVNMLGGGALALQGTDDEWVAVVDREVHSFEVVPADDSYSEERKSDDGESDSSEAAEPKALMC